jgi:tetratricopeptide (TPR) repeat protein
MTISPVLISSVIALVGLIGVISGLLWFRQHVRFMAKLHYDKGLAYLQTAEYSKAEQEFHAALKQQRAMLEAQYGLACTYLQQERYQEGIELLEHVVSAMPHNAIALYNLGLAYIDVGKLDDAQAALQTAADLKPAMKEIHYNLSKVLLEKGDAKQANAYCARALKLDQHYVKAQELHAQLAEIRYAAPVNLELIRRALQDFDHQDAEFMIKL